MKSAALPLICLSALSQLTCGWEGSEPGNTPGVSTVAPNPPGLTPIMAPLPKGATPPPTPGDDPADTGELLASGGNHLNYYGGRVLTNVSVVVVFWGPNTNNEVKNRIGGFYEAITADGYTDWLSEYNTVGVTPVDGQPGSNEVIGRGSLVAATTITPTHGGTSSVLDSDITAELATQITNNVLPAPDYDTLYMVYFPPGVGITSPWGTHSCQDFCGYHGTAPMPGRSSEIVYGVVADFGSGSGCDGPCGPGSQFDNVTMVSSHELVEAITDPEAGLVSGTTRPDAWRDPVHNEIGDICPGIQACVGGFVVQKEWSNTNNTCYAPTIAAPPFAGADAIAVNYTGTIVRRSRGSNFGCCNENWATSSFTGGKGTFFADVTGDGRADAIAVNSTGILVQRSNGWSFGSTETWSSTAFFGDRATYVADVTGDGMADVIALNNAGIVVRRSNGSGFGPSETWSTTPFFGDYGTYFADVTGDGTADAIASKTAGVMVRPSTRGSFAASQAWTTSAYVATKGAFFADVTGDGRADAIVVNNGQGVVVRRSTGSNFAPNELWASGSSYFGDISTAFADVTGDGRADEILVNTNGTSVRGVNPTATGFTAPVAWTSSKFTGVAGTFFANVDSPVTVRRPTWTPIAGGATAVGSGWVLGTGQDSNGNFGIYHWDPVNQNWAQVTGGAKSISVDLYGNPWVVNTSGQIYKWVGWAFFPFGGSFCASAVASGTNDNETWALQCDDGAVFHWNGISWQPVPGVYAQDIAVFSTPDPNCADHLPVIIKGDLNIYFYRHFDCGSGAFNFIKGGGYDLSTDFVVGTDGNVYHWDSNFPGWGGPEWTFYIAAPWSTDTKIGAWVNGVFAISPQSGAIQMITSN